MNKQKLSHYFKTFYRSFVWLFIVLLFLDVLTKQLVLAADVSQGTVIQDWGIVRINFILNYNAAFGIGFSDRLLSRISYLVVASAMSIGILTYLILKRKETNLIVRAAFVLIITGAVGNMIDRIFYSPHYAVVDWIDFYWFWPYVFNIADCCIVIGTGILLVYTIVLEVKEMIVRRNESLTEEKDSSPINKEQTEEKND
ncbi:MAG: signal peptidase II [Erysipelotrichia bacterium]|nr:signal peptidase II [Erysipelotrichia bacterium]